MKILLPLLLLVATFAAVQGQLGCDDATSDIQECVAREQSNDGVCLDCNATPPPAGATCTELQDWYCSLNTCCPDCERQGADAMECASEAAGLGCGDFEESLCTGEEGLSECSEALEAFTQCTVQNCPPDADIICDVNFVDADTCAELEAGCQFFNSCCNNSCGGEIEQILATCAFGVCTEAIDCGAPAPPGILPSPVAPSPTDTTEGESFEMCDEAIAAFTDCTISNCPADADVLCDPNLVDADTCADVEVACQFFSTCCNNSCGSEVEQILATCGFGVCPDAQCTAGETIPTAPVAEPVPAPTEPEPVPAPTEPVPAPPTSSAFPPGCGTDCCSEALANFASCTAQNCVEFDLECDATVEVDTCDELVAVCRDFHDCCGGRDGSGACGLEIQDILATCGLGVCGAIDCTAPVSQTTRTRELKATTGHRKLQTAFEGCDQALAAFTMCTAGNCPDDADVICDQTLDADNCADVEAACQAFSTCCSGQCGNEINGLLKTCAFGVCSDAQCTADGPAPMPTAPVYMNVPLSSDAPVAEPVSEPFATQTSAPVTPPEPMPPSPTEAPAVPDAGFSCKAARCRYVGEASFPFLNPPSFLVATCTDIPFEQPTRDNCDCEIYIGTTVSDGKRCSLCEFSRARQIGWRQVLEFDCSNVLQGEFVGRDSAGQPISNEPQDETTSDSSSTDNSLLAVIAAVAFWMLF